MNKTIIVLIACILQISLSSFVIEGRDVKRTNILNEHRLSQIDTLMKRFIKEEFIPSGIFYVWKDGREVYFKTFGLANREKNIPLKKDAIFRNASQTKLVTTVALLTLYEDGLFLLDEPVKKYLPEFDHPVVLEKKDNGEKSTRPAQGDITIRQLLSHSSGIGYDKEEGLEGIRYKEQISTEDAVNRMAKLPLKHDPGKGFTYGFNSDIAGHLAEVLSGKRLDVLIQERVLDPLKMTSSHFYLPQKDFARLVTLYKHPSINGPVVPADSLEQYYPLTRQAIYFGGGAGLSGTIEDYAHLCQMILNKGIYNGKRILSSKTVDQMCSDQLFGAAGKYQFGLGLEIATNEDFARRLVSPGSLRWGGAYGTQYLIDPKENMVVLFYTNKTDWNNKNWVDVWTHFLRIVYQSIE